MKNETTLSKSNIQSKSIVKLSSNHNRPLSNKINSQTSPKNLFIHSSSQQIGENANYQEFKSIKKKHDKIAILELEIQNIQNRLAEFYFKMKEILLKDETLSQELKDTFFNENLKGQLFQCDSITTIDFLQKIIFSSIDLSHSLAENINFSSHIAPNSSDYVIILQKLEEEIVLLKQKQLEDEYVIEALKAKIQELQEQNLKISEKSNNTAQSYKQDYYKLLTIIHELEYDITHLKNIISEKDANIQALTEKNFSIFVLEHKIKALDQKYQKDYSKAKTKFNKDLHVIKDSRISDPNYYFRMHSIDQKMKNLENRLYNTELKNQKLEGNQKVYKNELNEEKNSFEKTINQLNTEIIELKEKLAEKNREIAFLKSENARKNEVIGLKLRTEKDISKNIGSLPVTSNYKKLSKSLNLNFTISNKTWLK